MRNLARPIPDRKTQARRHQKRRRLHRLLKVVIVLTIPLYCMGFTLLALAQVERMLQQATSSPIVLGGLIFLLLLLIAEPFTGMTTNTCVAGVKCAAAGASHPLGCLTFVSLLISLTLLLLRLVQLQHIFTFLSR